MPEPSILDERLADIDRRLGTIQSGLEPIPVAEPPMTPPIALHGSEPASEPDATEDVLARLRDLSDAHGRLLELHRELLAQYAELLSLRAQAAANAGVSVTAGPFSDAASVRRFERALSGLPDVIGVSVREYLGADRVALDVQIAAR